MLAVRYVNLDLDSTLFIDDMLQYIFPRYGISRTSVIPSEVRNRYFEDLDYTFIPEIGDAVTSILQGFYNVAETVIEYSVIFRISEPNPRSHIANLLRFHRLAFLTDGDFAGDPNMWCSCLLHYLAIVTCLCIHYEQNYNALSAIDVITTASEVLFKAMERSTFLKVEWLKQYAIGVLSRSIITETTLYEIF